MFNSLKHIYKLIPLCVFGFVVLTIAGCSRGTPTLQAVQSFTVTENNLPETYALLGQLVEGTRALVTNQKTKLSPQEIREKLGSLQNFVGLASSEEFRQHPALVDSTPVDTETANRFSPLAVRGAVGSVTSTFTTSTLMESSESGPVLETQDTSNNLVLQVLLALFNFLNSLPPEPNPAPIVPPPDLLAAFPPLPPPQGFGIGMGAVQPNPLPPPPAQVQPPPKRLFCSQFGIPGSCCNPDNGAGALSDRCAIYYKLPLPPPRQGIFFFGSCQWDRTLGFINCPSSVYFTGWRCPPRDPNSC